jgi:predicted dehydrogenase
MAMARMSPTGIDTFCGMLFDYKSGAKAILESTFEADTPTEGYIYGTEGAIRLHSRFHHPEKISLIKNGNLEDTFNIKYKGNGYVHEIEEVNRCLLNRDTESEKLRLSTSLDLINIIDRVRNEIGLKYD